jgi:branched-chain amino acid transport system substrate-binding protein
MTGGRLRDALELGQIPWSVTEEADPGGEDMRRRGWSRLLVVLAAMSLLATACPDDNDVVDPVNDEPDLIEDELRIGYVLPETGPLSGVGPGLIRGIELAIDEIEDAGGPLGLPVNLLSGDEAGDEAVASESADSHLADGVHAIIGAAASGMSLAIIDQVTGAEVVMCSGSNTSPTFTDYPDDGYYFRTAPSDELQGPILADVVLEDGHERIALLGRGDDYGRALVGTTRQALEDAGAEIVLEEIYDPEAVSFDAEASATAAEDPDAVVLVTFDEGNQLIQDLLEAGITTDQM